MLKGYLCRNLHFAGIMKEKGGGKAKQKYSILTHEVKNLVAALALYIIT
jgi:hypothetical protein